MNPSTSAGSSAPRRPRLAILSYSSGEFDARSRRVARSAMAAGWDVVVYARWEGDLPAEEDAGGVLIVRAPSSWRLAIPGLRGGELHRFLARRARHLDAGDPGEAATDADEVEDDAGDDADGSLPGRRGIRSRLRDRARGRATRPIRRVLGQLMLFPFRPLGWAVAVEAVAEPADVWHGMWAGSLPALARLRGRHGGRTIYDSRDVYLHARSFGTMPRAFRAPFGWLERRWARRADAVITVNEPYARILETTLGVRIAAIVRNCPPRFDAPEPRPDLIRERLGLPAELRVVLYQGNLMTERGIEEGMDAILRVPGAVLVLLGYGSKRDEYAARAASAPYAGRVHLVDAVSPDELLTWTASADVMLMAIQPTTLNHRYTTPQKLWEALATGVPVVASDLPGMAVVVRETGAGLLCDPTDPASIAAAIRTLVEATPEAVEGYRRSALAAAHDRYNWEVQAEALLALYAGFAPAATAEPAAAASAGAAGG